MLRKIYFFSSIAFLYVMTVGVIVYSAHILDPPLRSVRTPKPVPSLSAPLAKQLPKIVSGAPVRIVIPAAGIDLPIDEGHYNPRNKTWTLSPVHAEFAVSTMPANDQAGATFIYGHGTQAVFGKLGSSPPATGSTAKVYTDSGHIFFYTLKSRHDLSPTDTSILSNATSGRPRLIVQTCTGAFSEWRTEFTFSYQKVQ